MRIKHLPIQTSFETGEPTLYAVSVVGRSPVKTFYVEQTVGTVRDPAFAPTEVGRFLMDMLQQDAIAQAVHKHGPKVTQAMIDRGEITVSVPDIPGVTSPGEWVNPRFGNPELHRQKYGLKFRTPETEREVLGEPERFHA